MEEKIREKIISLLAINGVSQTAMANGNSAMQRKLSRQLGKEKSTITLDTILSILDRFPNVSAEWLLRGNGEMLKSEQQPLAQVNLDYSTMGDNNVVAKNNSSVSGDVAALQNTIKELQKMINDQQKTINKLVEKL